MAIYGVTDTSPKNMLEGLPIMADVFKGTARTDDDIKKKRPGKELPHFRVVFRPAYAHLQSIWDEMYGAEPKTLSGAFIGSHTVDDAFITFNREWGKTGIIRECTGKSITRERDAKTERLVRLENTPCKSANGNKACDCKREGTLFVMFPKFSALTGVIGKVRFTTHSFEDIVSIYRSLATTQMLYGSLYKVYFTIYREQGETSFYDTKEGVRKKMKKWFMKIRVDEDFVKATLATQLTAGAIAPQLGAGNTPAPVIVDESANDVYYPAEEYDEEYVIEEAPKPITWIATNGNKDRILAWAKGWFKMSEANVFEAMAYDQSIREIAEYTGDNIRIRACIITWYANGDASKLQKIFATTECVPADISEQVFTMVNAMTAEWYGVEEEPEEV